MRAFSGVGESSRDVQQQFFYYIRYPDYIYTGRTNYSMKFCIQWVLFSDCILVVRCEVGFIQRQIEVNRTGDVYRGLSNYSWYVK